VPALHPPEGQDGPAWWFIFRGSRLLVRLGDRTAELPFADGPESLNLLSGLLSRHYLGLLDGRPCYAGEVAEEVDPPDGWSFQGLRRLFGRLPEPLVWTGGRAVQIVDWDRTHQFCGRCGAASEAMAHERAKQCPNCGLISYPRISPAMIVLVQRGDRLLLARSHRHPPGRYSVLAGFVEPGETLEEAVAREIKEEVGIEVRDIRYFGSQPWPFPNSLMIAFTCHYAGGDIVLEESEMADAGWFRVDEMPPVPPPISISRQLIDWFVAQQKGDRAAVESW
jgi:NAD+ diphosphatase